LQQWVHEVGWPVVVAGAQVVEAEVPVADEEVGDSQDGAGGGDDGFLLATAAADTPVAFPEVGVGFAGGHRGVPERPA